MKEYIRKHTIWLAPVLLLLIITPFTPMIDLFVAHCVFEKIGASSFVSTPFYDSVYLYGVIPSQIICALAVICLLASILLPKFKWWRPIAWTLALNLVIGSGLITHILLKEFWGRPRPRQIMEFGGHLPFRPYYIPKIGKASEPARSFPSGHSTTGFYFFCLYFLGRRYRKPWLAYGGLGFALILGGLLSWARIVQGGHFISDAFIAGLIMWLSAIFVDWLIFERFDQQADYS